MYISTSLLALAANLLATITSAQVLVNTSTTYQTIDGFGFSEAFGFGSAVQDAPVAQQNQTLTLLFNKTTGAGFTILRNRIAADPSDTIEPTNPGSPSATPTYVWNGNDDSQVWWSQKARQYGVEYITADAWSAPAFMKTNNNYEEGGYLCGVTGKTCTSGDWRQAYANYLVQYLLDYQSENITVDFVGFLNEPEYTGSYDGMLSNGPEAASFIPILYSTIAKANLTAGITCCDAIGWGNQVTYTGQFASDGAEQYLSRITSHWYASTGSSPINTTLRVWQTEYSDLNDAFSTVWHSTGAKNEGFVWASYIYQGLVEANLSAFLYWVGAQSFAGSSALISISGSGTSTTVTPSGTLWAFALFSRYIRPNAVRVGTSGAPTNTKVAAFQNTDGSIAVVMLNSGTASQSVTFGGVNVTSVTAQVMDSSVKLPTTLVANITGGDVKATLPGYSLATFVIT